MLGARVSGLNWTYQTERPHQDRYCRHWLYHEWIDVRGQSRIGFDRFFTRFLSASGTDGNSVKTEIADLLSARSHHRLLRKSDSAPYSHQLRGDIDSMGLG